MKVLSILQIPDPRLFEQSKPVTAFDADLNRFAHQMALTRRTHGAAGLAAPQVGVPIRLVVFDPARFCGFGVAVNPVVVDHGVNTGVAEEGCLSVDHGRTSVPVRRWVTITVEFQDLAGRHRTFKTRDFAARVFQHEVDHLNGIVIEPYK